MIRAAAEGSEPDPLIDLSQIDFDALAAQLRRPQAGRDRPARRAAQAAGDRRGHAQPDPLRPRRADRGADRRVQRRQPQHRRVPAPAHRAVQDADRRGAAGGQRGHDRGGAGDLRPAHQARAGAHRRRARDGQGQRQAAARPPARQARPRLAPQGRATTADVRSTIRASSTPTCPPTRTRRSSSTPRSRLVFDHVAHRLRRRRRERLRRPKPDYPVRAGRVRIEYAEPIDVNRIADDVVARILADPAFAAQVAHQLRGE